MIQGKIGGEMKMIISANNDSSQLSGIINYKIINLMTLRTRPAFSAFFIKLTIRVQKTTFRAWNIDLGKYYDMITIVKAANVIYNVLSERY